MVSLPGGTVTFLFTDIEGSTRLWDAFADDMRRALAIHNDLVTKSVKSHGGYTVKNTGDGLFVVFDSAAAAVAAAVEAQSDLARAEWPPVVGTLGVRMALHTAAIEPSGGDYHGPDVNRVARIESAGHGGQVLLSSSTFALVEESLPDGVSSIDLGSHLLRGLSEPEQIRQLSIPGLRSTFPPLRTGSVIGTLLPEFATSFVGRRSDLAELGSMLIDSDCRLVTLLGPGGIGKTRLAVETARAVSARVGASAHFLALVGISQVSDVVKALGDSIGFTFDIHISAQIPEKTQLFDRLRAQPLVLVLDNLEHLPDIADLITEMLMSIPTLKILATSRRQLDLTAEWRYEVRGLDYDGDHDAAALFIDRAGRAGGAIDPTGPDGVVIEALCEVLGGLPLAIELAAAWTNLLSPSEISAEISRDVDFLQGSSRDAPDRHRSMRAVFEHSWRLLTDDLQRVYAGLSVFAAPFDRAGAAAVAGASLNDLKQLAKQSLLTRSSIDRYALHPLLREFAAEQLGTEATEVTDRYARHYWRFLVDRAPAIQGGAEQMAMRDEIAQEIDHIRAVSDWWVDHFTDEDMVAGVNALNEFYFLHSWVDQAAHLGRIRRRYEQNLGQEKALSRHPYLLTMVALALTETSFSTPDEIASLLALVEAPWRVRGGLGWGVWSLVKGIELALRGDYEASLDAYDAAARHRSDMTPLLDLQLDAWRGWSQLELGRVDEATRTFDLGLKRAIAAQHYLGQAFLLSKYGLAADATGDYDRAVQLHHEGREIFVKAGDLGGQGYTLSRLSWSYYLKGEYDLARRYALEGLGKFEEINHRWGIAVSFGRLGLAELELGRWSAAVGHFLECLDQATEGGLVPQQHYAVTGIGRALVKAGRYQEAGRLLGFEANADANPYSELAQAGLDSIPAEVRAAATSESIDFTTAVELCRRATETLIGPGEVSEQVSDA